MNSINRVSGLRVVNSPISLRRVRLISGLRGVQGCMLTAADGLYLTGQLPAHLDQSRLSVFAPELFRKVGLYAQELAVGQVRRMTLFTELHPLSIFQAEEIYLIVIHDTRHFSKALLRWTRKSHLNFQTGLLRWSLTIQIAII